MKSKIEMILDEVCGQNDAKWNIERGTLIISREGFKPLKFRALGHDGGVELETAEHTIDVLWEDLQRGKQGLTQAVSNMTPERQKRVRWNLMAETLAMMAIKEKHSDTSDWKTRIDPEIRTMLEVFPEFEHGEGIMSPCPAMWLEISRGGWDSVPMEATITQGGLAQELIKIVTAAERQVGDTMRLGLPLSDAGGVWAWKAQVHFIRKWLRMNPLLWLVTWDKIDRATMAEALSGLRGELEPLIEALTEVKKKDPATYSKMAVMWR